MALESMDVIRADSFANLPLKATDGQIGIVRTATDTQSFLFNMDLYNSTGKGWTPSQKSQVKRSTVTVNGKNTGSVLIYTLEDVPYNFYPTQVIQLSVSMATVVTPPTVSVGSNASSYNNIQGASLITTVLNAVSPGVGASTSVSNPIAPLAGNTQIYANVSVGALAGTYQVRYAIAGFYDM